MTGAANAHYLGIKAFSETDQTEDLKAIDVPTLVIQGDDDQVVPYKDAALLQAKLIKNATLKIYPGYPHGMLTVNAGRDQSRPAGFHPRLALPRYLPTHLLLKEVRQAARDRGACLAASAADLLRIDRRSDDANSNHSPSETTGCPVGTHFSSTRPNFHIATETAQVTTKDARRWRTRGCSNRAPQSTTGIRRDRSAIGVIGSRLQSCRSPMRPPPTNP